MGISRLAFCVLHFRKVCVISFPSFIPWLFIVIPLIIVCTCIDLGFCIMLLRVEAIFFLMKKRIMRDRHPARNPNIPQVKSPDFLSADI